MAQLEFHYGVMGSSKSAEVAKRAYEQKNANRNTLIAKPGVDTKSADRIISRIPGLSVKVDLVYPCTFNLFERIRALHKENPLDQVIIDEAQFSTPAQIEQLQLLAWHKDTRISVICYGLKQDFQTKLFPGSQRLLELADRVVQMEEIKLCTCGRKATQNIRKKNGVYTFEGDQVLIDDGSAIEYVSICTACYLEASKFV